jgi:hypothetical protein
LAEAEAAEAEAAPLQIMGTFKTITGLVVVAAADGQGHQPTRPEALLARGTLVKDRETLLPVVQAHPLEPVVVVLAEYRLTEALEPVMEEAVVAGVPPDQPEEARIGIQDPVGLVARVAQQFLVTATLPGSPLAPV